MFSVGVRLVGCSAKFVFTVITSDPDIQELNYPQRAPPMERRCSMVTSAHEDLLPV